MKNGIAITVKYLNTSAKKQIVSKNFNALPRFNETYTLSDLEAPTYLKAYKANTKLGINITIPPAKADKPAVFPQPIKTISAMTIAKHP